jgi:hypothetical protein
MNLLFQRPGTFSGMDVRIIDAQQQRRTARDVKGPWIRPKVPNKRRGRWGTRRMWKRRNSPHHIMIYREPADVLVLHGRTIIATPLQADALRRQTHSL